MLSHRLPFPRILSSNRPLRPPNRLKRVSGPRLFTQNSQLLLISPATPRPQLPFLYPSSSLQSPTSLNRGQFQYQISRLLTTERKLFIKDVSWKVAKYTFYGWSFLVLLGIAAFGLQNERLEREHPTPPMWKMLTRINYRNARNQENPATNGLRRVDWASTGNMYCSVLSRLEDPLKDGFDLRAVDGEEDITYVNGICPIGLDISAKPEPWRREYHAVLMGTARVAENIDGYVRDRTRGIIFPPDMVIRPSDTRPKPLPLGCHPSPLEENCDPAFETAEHYYMKILTTHGFNSGQRLQAALAWANFLDFKGLRESAEEMYDWGLDIAMGALPVGVGNVADIKTGIISADAQYVSSNLLRATTALATHHARNSDLSAALPIFLSILRARRQLTSPPHVVSETITQTKPPTTFQNLVSLCKSIIVTPPYPPEPPTGDEVPTRTKAAVCEEAGIMAYIGEILFASSSPGPSSPTTSPNNKTSESTLFSRGSSKEKGVQWKQQSGLSWTRDAVDIAETTFLAVDDDDDHEARKRCSECLDMGMGNWSKMVGKFLKEERASASLKNTKSNFGGGGNWFWSNGGNAGGDTAKGKWEQEAKLVEEKMVDVRRLLGEEEQRRQAEEAGSGWFLV